MSHREFLLSCVEGLSRCCRFCIERGWPDNAAEYARVCAHIAHMDTPFTPETIQARLATWERGPRRGYWEANMPQGATRYVHQLFDPQTGYAAALREIQRLKDQLAVIRAALDDIGFSDPESREHPELAIRALAKTLAEREAELLELRSPVTPDADTRDPV